MVQMCATIVQQRVHCELPVWSDAARRSAVRERSAP